MAGKRYHLIGIGGHTMRGLAGALRARGHEVTGTDEGAYPPGSDWLDQQQLTWWREPDPAHLDGVSEVIITGHIRPDHPEVAAAVGRGLPIRSYPEVVGELTRESRRIVVAGTHGKTTTTSLLAWCFEIAGRSPDFVVGITPRNFDTSVRLAGSSVTIIEGDEYRSSLLDPRSKFVHYAPDVLVLTSIELDHPDLFKDLGEITARFTELAHGLPATGRIYYWQGSAAVRKAVEGAAAEAESYDADQADWTAEHVRFEPAGLRFTLKHHGEALGELVVPLYGRHNVRNVIAAAAVALGEGIPLETLQEALVGFKGASRRFERLTRPDAAVTVIDDYAHHPTEAQTTIEAVKLHFPGRVIAVYQPHTFSRTEKLLKEYQKAFADADEAFLAPIEAAREEGAAAGVSSADIAAGAGKRVRYVEDREAMLGAVTDSARPGDTVLSMSVAGNQGFAEELAARLRERE